MLEITIRSKSAEASFTHLAGPLEFGRAPQRTGGPMRYVIGDDMSVSGDHMRMEEVGHGRIRIENFSRKNSIGFSVQRQSTTTHHIEPQCTKVLVGLCMQLTLGESWIEVRVVVDESEPLKPATDGITTAPVREDTGKMLAHEPFLQAIRNEPNADFPRLIYADWLEERGDPRGQLLRTECALAAAAPNSPHYSDLQGTLSGWAWRFNLDWVAQVSRVPITLEPDWFRYDERGRGMHESICWCDKRLRYFPNGADFRSWMGLPADSQPEPPVPEVRPTPAEWQAFWSVLDANRCWDWIDADYSPAVRDGMPWHLEIGFGGKRVACRGDGGEPPRFRQFHDAMYRLFLQLMHVRSDV